jgi:hypothetical protein
MGPGKYEHVGKPQSALIRIDPMICPRRTHGLDDAPPPPRLKSQPRSAVPQGTWAGRLSVERGDCQLSGAIVS